MLSRRLLTVSVGEDETASGIKSYQHPDLNTLVLWDLPGGGAERNPGEPYFPDKMMFAFDALIVVTSAKFLQIELDIAKQANEKGVPIYFVRNKADQLLFAHSIESKLRKNSKMTWEQAAMELQKEVHKNIRGQIEATGLELDKLFILSAWHLQELVELMVKSKEPSATLHLMDEFRLVDMLIKETISYRSAASFGGHSIQLYIWQEFIVDPIKYYIQGPDSSSFASITFHQFILRPPLFEYHD
ncbi:hypothetical protein BC938DRAFT_473991 [Jimgerdemannia flammicorona]|uniref:IRG-type G domain-containing protein n=1 Tax=Jimgerdemannia flammicorona TaxID=994334 RepID=A0A433QSY6_9FUNG|nr:hypothetical protein BC938DRAFT_473991 [Jimgerdemannia flammicorona]